MKLVRIFGEEASPDGIWSVRLDGQIQNEFDRFFDSMDDIEWLRHFFTKNKADLQSGFFGDIDIEEAALRSLDEMEEMEELLYSFAKQGFKSKYHNLQHFFKPLNNFEYAITVHQKSKARKGWLRVYAIRLDQNCYLITGGAIKLTKDMNHEHLQYELKKLELVRSFLKNNGIDYPEYLNLRYE